MIRWLSEQGFTVFVCSWVNPDADKAAFGFDDYLEKGVYRATAKVMEQCGTDRLNTVGYCIGGTLMGAALAHMAARGDERVNACTFFAAQHDFAEAGDLLLFTDEHWLNEIEAMMDQAGGVLPGSAMADTFNALRANDLIWSFVVNNYLLGKDPFPFDLLYWNSDSTRMPAAMHSFYLREMYQENLLVQPGGIELLGVPIDLGTIKTPIFMVSAREDHIAPWRSTYALTQQVAGPKRFVLAASGHIAGVINPPEANKYSHWTNEKCPRTPEEWLAGAEEQPGSWWPTWGRWMNSKGGARVPARQPGDGKLQPLEDAPGSYVKVRAID